MRKIKKKKDPKKVILKSLSDKNIKESKITKTEKDEKEENQLPNIENKEYKNIITNFKTKYIELGNNQEIEIPKYPLLIGKIISKEFYTDIYRYLFIEKHNLNITRYPQWVSDITPKTVREKKKRIKRKIS